MDHGTAVLAHHEYEDFLAPAALGALRPEEHTRLVAHLRTCASCRETLGRLLSAADVLPLTVEARAPSEALRARLLAQVTSDPRARRQLAAPLPRRIEPVPDAEVPVPLRPDPVPITERRRRGGLLWAVAIAAILLLGLVGGVLLDRLVLRGEGDGDVQRIALQSPAGLALGDARLEYLADERIVRFVGPNLPAPPEGQVYQAWLIAGDDAPPAPVGVIDPATGAFVTSADLGRYATFAVTVEPGQLGSSAPTTPPVIVAALPDPASA